MGLPSMERFEESTFLNSGTNVVNFYTDCITTSWLANSEQVCDPSPGMTASETETGSEYWDSVPGLEDHTSCGIGLEYDTCEGTIEDNLENSQEIDQDCEDIISTLQKIPCSQISFIRRDDCGEDQEQDIRDEEFDSELNSEPFNGPEFWSDASIQIQEIICQNFSADEEFFAWDDIHSKTEETYCQNDADQDVNTLCCAVSTQTDENRCTNIYGDDSRFCLDVGTQTDEICVPQLWYDASTQTDETVCHSYTPCSYLDTTEIIWYDAETQTEEVADGLVGKKSKIEHLLDKEECPIPEKLCKPDNDANDTIEDTSDDLHRYSLDYLIELCSFSRTRLKDEMVSSIDLTLDELVF